MKKLLLLTLLLATSNAFCQTGGLEVVHPRVPGTDLFFSMRANEDGVCKMLGYMGGVSGSKVKRLISEERVGYFNNKLEVHYIPEKAEGLIVDENGVATGQSHKANVMGLVTCKVR